MKLINEDTMKGRPLTTGEAEKLKKSIDAGEVTDEFGEVLVWDEITDFEGDVILEEGGYENCLTAIK